MFDLRQTSVDKPSLHWVKKVAQAHPPPPSLSLSSSSSSSPSLSSSSSSSSSSSWRDCDHSALAGGPCILEYTHSPHRSISEPIRDHPPPSTIPILYTIQYTQHIKHIYSMHVEEHIVCILALVCVLLYILFLIYYRIIHSCLIVQWSRVYFSKCSFQVLFSEWIFKSVSFKSFVFQSVYFTSVLFMFDRSIVEQGERLS